MPSDDTAAATVLVADDNPQILELLEAYLEPLRLRILTARDGQETLDAVASHRPDLILLDIMMPRRSGFEICRILKQDPQYREIPIIMVTALNEVADMERARESGADHYLSKPVNKLELLERVREFLNRDQSGSSATGDT
jgi:CheY-like chemotaxis protein